MSKIGELQQHREHCRDEGRDRDLLSRNRRQRLLRREAGDDDVLAARDGCGVDAPAGAEVEKRPGVQMHQAVVETEMRDRRHRVSPQIAVAEHHSLGTAGGAAGIEQTGDVVFPAHRIRRRFHCTKCVLIPDGSNAAAGCISFPGNYQRPDRWHAFLPVPHPYRRTRHRR